MGVWRLASVLAQAAVAVLVDAMTLLAGERAGAQPIAGDPARNRRGLMATVAGIAELLQ